MFFGFYTFKVRLFTKHLIYSMFVIFSHQIYSHKDNLRDKTIVLNKSTFIIESGREPKGLQIFNIYTKYILLKELCYEYKFYRSRMMDRDHLDLIKISKNNLLVKIINLDIQYNQL